MSANVKPQTPISRGALGARDDQTLKSARPSRARHQSYRSLSRRVGCRRHFRELENLLRTRGARATCPSCDLDDWVAIEETLQLRAFDPQEDVKYDILAAVCVNCGFVRLHMPSVLYGLEDASSEGSGPVHPADP